MSTSAPITTDEFQALEQKVLRAVEIVRGEREARAGAEAEVARLRAQVAEQQSQLAAEREAHAAAAKDASAQLAALEAERAEVRERLGRMLQQMDDLI